MCISLTARPNMILCFFFAPSHYLTAINLSITWYDNSQVREIYNNLELSTLHYVQSLPHIICHLTLKYIFSFVLLFICVEMFLALDIRKYRRIRIFYFFNIYPLKFILAILQNPYRHQLFRKAP